MPVAVQSYVLSVVKMSVLIDGCVGPGCSSREPLNSRTFNIALETSASTCAPHRTVRQMERDFICSRASKQRLRRNLDYQRWKSSRGQSSGGKVGQGHPAGAKVRSSSSVYDFSSSDSSDREVRRQSRCLMVSMMNVSCCLTMMMTTTTSRSPSPSRHTIKYLCARCSFRPAVMHPQVMKIGYI